MTLYVGSDGYVYTPSFVVERLAAGDWRTCLHETDTGRELVETDHGDLLLLVPTDELDRRPVLRDPGEGDPNRQSTPRERR